MRKKSKFFPTFFIFLILSAVILALSFYSMMSDAPSFLEKSISFVPKTAYGLYQNLPLVSEGDEIKRLKKENLELVSQLSDYEKLKNENIALLSQYQTEEFDIDNLLPARIVGAPGFIPGVTPPVELILDRGEKDGLRVGSAVIFENNLVGKVVKTSSFLSKVDLVVNPSVSFPVQTSDLASGIANGQGENKMTLENVLTSDDLKIDELIFTNGEIDINGIGIPPNLVVGRVESIEKIPTAVFQKAELKSLLDFEKLSIVFVVVERR